MLQIGDGRWVMLDFSEYETYPTVHGRDGDQSGPTGQKLRTRCKTGRSNRKRQLHSESYATPETGGCARRRKRRDFLGTCGTGSTSSWKRPAIRWFHLRKPPLNSSKICGH